MEQQKKNLMSIIAAAIIKQKNPYLHVGSYAYDCVEVDGSLDVGELADAVIEFNTAELRST